MIVFVGHGVRHLTNLLFPGEGIFESFFARHGTDVGMPTRMKETETEHMFPHFHASRTRRTVWKYLEIMEANENKPKVSRFYCIDQLNLLRYCGIKVNGSKEKPSRFLQVQLISVWLIRYNHCKLIKLTFFVPFTKNGIFKLTKCGLSPKGFCILCSVLKHGLNG